MSTHKLHGSHVQIKDTKIIGLAVAEHIEGRYTVMVENSHVNVAGMNESDLILSDDTDAIRFYYDKYYPSDHDGAEGPYGEDTACVIDDEQGGIVAYVHEDYASEVVNALRVAHRHA